MNLDHTGFSEYSPLVFVHYVCLGMNQVGRRKTAVSRHVINVLVYV